MTMLDKTDEEIAKAIIKRLEDMGLRSLRNQAAQVPVSRGTLNRWRKGDYLMHDDTREVCLAWLGTQRKILTTSYADGLTDAMHRYEEAVQSMMERARDQVENLITKANATPSVSVGDFVGDVEAVLVRPSRARGKKGGDGEP